MWNKLEKSTEWEVGRRGKGQEQCQVALITVVDICSHSHIIAVDKEQDPHKVNH